MKKYRLCLMLGFFWLAGCQPKDEFTERQGLSFNLPDLRAQRESDSLSNLHAYESEESFHMVMKEEFVTWPGEGQDLPQDAPQPDRPPKARRQLVRFAPPDTAQPKIPTQMVKVAQVRLRVDDYDQTKKSIRATVAKHQGYIGESTETNSGSEVENELVIRVPNARFDTLLAELLPLANFIHRNEVKAQDVTNEYVDLLSRIRAKQTVEERYLELLKQARNVTEVLEVEEKLRLIREEKEVSQGRLKYLRDQVQFSTIYLTFYSPLANFVGEPSPSFLSRLSAGLTGGWQGLQTFLVGLVYAWPFILITLAASWWLRRSWKAHRAKQRATATPAPGA
jgi:hypothetical protein